MEKKIEVSMATLGFNLGKENTALVFNVLALKSARRNDRSVSVLGTDATFLFVNGPCHC